MLQRACDSQPSASMSPERAPARTSATRLRPLEYSEQARLVDPCKSASFLNLSVRLVPFTAVPLGAPRQKDFIAITMVAKASRACFRKGRQLQVAAKAITQVLRRAHQRPLITATIRAATAAVVLLRKGHLVAAAVEARRHQIWI